ncbi:MAG: DUF2812 domain-containing protein [Firmicutes bacterium]|jgi:hypothetical protein|nr:DUF2812 domain-containing protein [Bacillota bacterium]
MKEAPSKKSRWFFWFGWATEKLEAWLEKEARLGWHLVWADRGLNRFHFRKGPAKQVRICIDYQPGQPADEYWTLFQDAGWELVAEGFGYYIWRTEYEGADRPDIFTDVDSLIQRNQRIMAILVFILLCQLPSWSSSFLFGWWKSAYVKVLLGAYALTCLVLAGYVVAIHRANARLRARRP